MRKNKARKIVVFLMAVMIAFGSLSISSKVEAASKPYMKKLNVTWDLKKNKTVTYKSRYPGLGMVKQKARMTNYKVKNSRKRGYKELTFTIQYTRYWNMSKSQVHKLAKYGKNFAMGSSGGDYYCVILDYNTGKPLGYRNKVTIERKAYGLGGGHCSYRDNHGCYVDFCGSNFIEVKVTYPKNYKGLCIGIGGFTTVGFHGDKMFKAGRKEFGKTDMYSRKDKSVAHFMRVN